MNPNEIARLLASGDKEQIKEAQRQLQALGHYSGKIDGALGKNPSQSKTMFAAKAYADAEAAKAAQMERQAARQAEIDLLNARSGSEKSAAETEALQQKTAAERLYNEQATSGLGMATQSAASLAAPAAATALGLKFGEKVNDRLDRAQERRNITLRGAAEDRVRGLTTRDGAATGTKLAGAMPFSNSAMRATSRMAPHLGLGALSAAKGAHLLSDVDEDQPFYPRMADRAAGLGYVGFGAGLAKRGIEYAASPGVSPDAQALSVINSSQLRRNPAGGQASLSRPLQGESIPSAPSAPSRALPAPEPAPAPPPAASAAGERLPNAQRLHMAAEAARGGKVKSRLKKEAHYNMMKRALKPENMPAVAESLGLAPGADRKTILEHARNILKIGGKSSILLPFAVGSYTAASGDAEAADGSAVERAGNAAGNFAAGAGAAYGGIKISDALAKAAPSVGRAIGGGAAMAMPNEVIGSITDEFASPEARNLAARNFPEFMQFGAVNEAREMATVPDRGERGLLGRRDLNAGNLQIPDMGEFPEAIDADVARAYRKSPRRTVIELSRSSGLDPEDIAMLAGVSAEDVTSVMKAIPQQALAAR